MRQLPWVVPSIGVFLIALVVMLASVEAGYRFGRYERARHHEPDRLAGELVNPLLVLLGLMLAFTFGWAATRFDARRAARVDEAKAIGRVYRLADFTADHRRDRVRAIVERYVQTSLTVADRASFDRAFEQREQLYRELWIIAAEVGREQPTSAPVAQFVASVNDMLDVHLGRAVLALTSRIPEFIMVGLAGILVLTMLVMGYRFGLAGSPRTPALVPVALALALVIFLISDLDRPLSGPLRVTEDAMAELQRDIRGWEQRPDPTPPLPPR